MTLPIAIRPACTDDLPLLLNSWLKSYRNAPAVTTVPNELYFDEGMGQKARILSLLGECETRVACDPEDHEVVYGWITFEPTLDLPTIVHYAYVKQAYRRQGIGTALLRDAGVVGDAPFWISHETPVVNVIRRNGLNCVHNPFVHMYEREMVEFAEGGDN